MKHSLIFLILLAPFLSNAQDYQRPNEKVQFEFRTRLGKRLVIALDTNENYLVYRYGTSDRVELEFPDKLDSSWEEFQYSWYLRGGGETNEGMDLDYLYFDKGNFTYVVFREYYARSQKTAYGIKVINRETQEKTVIGADPATVKGTLADFRDMDKIKEGEELFD